MYQHLMFCRQVSDKPSTCPMRVKIPWDRFNRKCQDYVYVKREYRCTPGDMWLEHFFNENLNMKNLTHYAVAVMICHERYDNLPPISAIIWCYCCIYWITVSNKSKKSVENGNDSNWNGPIPSHVCDVTVIYKLRKRKLVFWTLFQLLSRSNTCRLV